MNNLDKLINPETEEVIYASTGTTWLWVVLFGPFTHLFTGRISTFFIALGAIIITLGLAGIYYLFWCRTVNRNYYVTKGYVQHSMWKKEQDQEKRHQQMLEMVVAVK